mgnify:CR=1 FL=1
MGNLLHLVRVFITAALSYIIHRYIIGSSYFCVIDNNILNFRLYLPLPRLPLRGRSSFLISYM